MNASLYPGKVFRERRGIALVSVLILVVLLTAVIIGFWATSTLEYTASRSYKASSSARLMADVAVNLVQGQINEATSQGMTTAWASQPGAIRVYNNSGALQEIYRLYSAQNLTTTTVTGINGMNIGNDTGIATPPGTSTTATQPGTTNDMPPNAWPTSPSLWVDLNAPANDASGTAHFPIFNESLAANVDGFSIDTANTPGYSTVQATQPAPMPVRWLYVLQNGQIIAPDTTSTATALTFQNAAVIPSTLNPIVGRIAFWTDDETCKVNINTAGGDGVGTVTSTNPLVIDPTPISNATFWDTPHFTSIYDVSVQAPPGPSLATSQPAQGEFQRYPGHPATVALHNVLYGLGWTNNTEYGATPSGWTSMPSTNFYSLTPRYSIGGSQGGTVTVDVSQNGSAIPLKGSPQNHLYSSVAEMLFAPGANRPVSVLNGADSPTQQKIETARFFLTAHSRAPEVTLSGQPRISIWPEMVTKNELPPTGDPLNRPRTAIDQLLAFCATNSGNEYYFTRYDPTSCSADISIARNVTLLEYLDHFTSLAIPGYGGIFDTKYGVSGMRQILTEIFDYIRTINICDSTLPYAQTYAQPWFHGLNSTGSQSGLFQVAPSRTDYNPSLALAWAAKTPTTQGIGIYPRLNEVGIQFVAMGQGDSPTMQLNPSGSLAAQTGVALNPVYVNTPSSAANGDSGATIFGQGDSGTDPNDLTGVATKNTMVMATNSFLPSPPNPANTPNPNVGTWVPPGNEVTGSTTTMAIQAFLLLSFINPSQMEISNGVITTGYGLGMPGVWVQISGLGNFGATGVPGSPYNPLQFPDPATLLFYGGYTSGDLWEEGSSWDTFQFWSMCYTMSTYQTPTSSKWDSINPFYSKIIPVTIYANAATRGLYFSGGTITVTLYDGGGLNAASPTPTGSPPSLPSNFKVVQTYTITFPAGTFPLPTFSPPYNSASMLALPGTPAAPPTITFRPPAVAASTNAAPLHPYIPSSGPSVGISGSYSDRWKSSPAPTPPPPPPVIPATLYNIIPKNNNPNATFILMGDVVQSMVLGNSVNPNNATWTDTWTDARMLAAATIPSSAFSTNPLWGKQAFAHNFWDAESTYYTDPNTDPTLGPQPHVYPALGTLNKNVTPSTPVYFNNDSSYTPYTPYTPAQIVGFNGYYGAIPNVPPTLSAGIPNLPEGGANMDWDNGVGCLPDGPWVNKADEGSLVMPNKSGNGAPPYYWFCGGLGETAPAGVAFFSPNREVPSPGMFGSLPTGIDPTGNAPTPWQTLLFRPDPGHFGATSPPDHLLLDLFWMPVAEPYAISEPFSSAGKINLNYQIEPFTYITRSTAIRAVLNTQKITQLSATGSQGGVAIGTIYKEWPPTRGLGMTTDVRFPLDVNMTLTQFDNKFNGVTAGTPDIFHSASQICEMYLVPKLTTNPEPSVSQFATDWYDGKTYGLVGDNVRERPYANIYGLVTTKSNTFTVYYRVQSLKNAEPATAAGQAQWNENQGTVLGEYRGSTILERYIDPNQTLPDFAANPGGAGTLDGGGGFPSYYRWRVVDNHQFAP